MHCMVTFMRREGVRLLDYEASQGPAVDGNLSTRRLTTETGSYLVAELHARDAAPDAKPIATLYEPVITEIGRGVLWLRGFERHKRGDRLAGVVQEWRCGVSYLSP